MAPASSEPLAGMWAGAPHLERQVATASSSQGPGEGQRPSAHFQQGQGPPAGQQGR